MNILLVNKYHWPKGGSEAAYFGQMDLLRNHGHRVIPFSMKGKRNIPCEHERFFVEEVDYDLGGIRNKISSAGKILYSFDARRKMAALLREEKADVAHFHIFQHQISPSVFGPLRAQNVPVVLTLHDLKPICPNYKMLVNGKVCEECKGLKFYNCLLHKCSKGSAVKSLVSVVEMYFHYAMRYYQSVDKYVAVSDFYRRKMIEFGFSPERVVHIPNSIDASLVTPGDTDCGYGLYFGRLSEEKGLITLLEALRSCPDIPFVIVGSGPLEPQLRRMASEWQLNVTFCGFKSGAELHRIVSDASFTVLPSEWYENCPMSVLESFSFGKAVVGSRIGGIPELIADGTDGLTFEAGSPESLVEKLKLLWEDPGARRAMGRAGRRKVEEDYTPEKQYRSIMAVYAQVCGNLERQ